MILQIQNIQVLPRTFDNAGTTSFAIAVATDIIDAASAYTINVYDDFDETTYIYSNLNMTIPSTDITFGGLLDPFHYFFLYVETARTGDTKPVGVDLYIPPAGYIEVIENGDPTKISSPINFIDMLLDRTLDDTPTDTIDLKRKALPYPIWNLGVIIDETPTDIEITFQSKDYGINDSAAEFVVGHVNRIGEFDSSLGFDLPVPNFDENLEWPYGTDTTSGKKIIPFFTTYAVTITYVAGFESSGGKLTISKAATNWKKIVGGVWVDASPGDGLIVDRAGDRFGGSARLSFNKDDENFSTF